MAVVLAVWTGGASSWLIGLSGAIAEGAIAVIMYLAMPFLLALALDFVMSWVVEILGPKFAIILTVAAMVAIALIPGGTVVMMNMEMTTGIKKTLAFII